MASILKVDTIQDQSGNNIINENADTITIGASGDTITIPTGASLTVPNGGLSGQNYPAFEAYLSADQAIGDIVLTKIQIDTEVFDTDNYYDNATNYRFTPLVAGKYYVYTQLYLYGSGDFDRGRTFIYKNGTSVRKGVVDPVNTTPLNASSVGVSAIIDMNGSTDYLEVHASVQGDIANVVQGGTDSYFGAYRIGD